MAPDDPRHLADLLRRYRQTAPQGDPEPDPEAMTPGDDQAGDSHTKTHMDTTPKE